MFLSLVTSRLAPDGMKLTNEELLLRHRIRSRKYRAIGQDKVWAVNKPEQYLYHASGGPKIRAALNLLLQEINNGDDPYRTHQTYERIHPFTNGNGRSGRALWLWSMNKNKKLHYVMKLGFLHNWYYQSLEHEEST